MVSWPNWYKRICWTTHCFVFAPNRSWLINMICAKHDINTKFDTSLPFESHESVWHCKPPSSLGQTRSTRVSPYIVQMVGGLSKGALSVGTNVWSTLHCQFQVELSKACILVPCSSQYSSLFILFLPPYVATCFRTTCNLHVPQIKSTRFSGRHSSEAPLGICDLALPNLKIYTKALGVRHN